MVFYAFLLKYSNKILKILDDRVIQWMTVDDLKKNVLRVILLPSRCVESPIRGVMGLVFFFGIDKTPLSDVSELFLKEIKWTANPDGSLSMPIPPTKQPKPDLETHHPLKELSTQ